MSSPAKLPAQAKKKNDKPEKPQEKTPQLNEDGTVKTKAQLKAERRALQEQQRAAKAAGTAPQHKQKQGEKNKQNTTQQKTQQAGQQQSQQKSQQQPQAKQPKDGVRVAYNVQMDDPKTQKKVSKKLAKQNVPQQKQAQKKALLFSHLHQYERDAKLTKDIRFSSNGKIHPAIIKLGLQYAQGVITGSNARSIALLTAFKQVITDYKTPPSKELSRDLETRIKPCISFLSQCRHLSVSMGNAIKFVKQQITTSPHNLTESQAKSELLESIDRFIEENIVLAGKSISEFTNTKICNGDKILVYGFSALMVQIVKDAKNSGKNFQVVVVDSRPDFQGRETLRRLSTVGIKCTYVLLPAVSYIMKEVTGVFLGAHALLANGYVLGRAGSAVVAMVARANNVPVMACCETYKFCPRVQTDAFVFNELGDPDALVSLDRPGQAEDPLVEWRQSSSLYLLNLVYDVTPSDFVDIAITELGMIPCTSVPVVLRVKNTDQT